MNFKNIPPEMLSMMQAMSRSQEILEAQDKHFAAETIKEQNETIARLQAENAALRVRLEAARGVIEAGNVFIDTAPILWMPPGLAGDAYRDLCAALIAYERDKEAS